MFVVRNIWAFLEMSAFLQLRQMVSSVSRLDDMASTANLVMSRRAKVVLFFAPWTSKLRGTYVSMLSGIVRRTPSSASWSALSFPISPSCPLVHWNVVGAGRRLKWYAMALKRVALAIPIQPVSSQFFRCVVSPSMTYFESVMIFRGVSMSADCRATSTAIPLPHTAFCLPLLAHDPSVYMVNWFLSCPRSTLGGRRR